MPQPVRATDTAATEPALTPAEAGPAPSGVPEFSLRAILTGLFVAAVIGASYPYVVLKIGFGPTISVVSAFLGYMVLSAIGFVSSKATGKNHRSNRYEYNIVQTAGTAAGQAGFMCVLLAAFDMLAANPALGFTLSLSGVQIFLWLCTAGLLGVLLAVPLRRHYIDEENLTFADGTAAGETLVILDEDRQKAARKVWALVAGGALSGVISWLRDASKLIPQATPFGGYGALNMGIAWSALSFGSGMLIGLRITLSMLIGSVLAWVVIPPILRDQGIVTDWSYGGMLRWVMWPATGLMVAGGLTALALKWRLIARTFSDLRRSKVRTSDLPLRWVVIGSVALTVALVAIQQVSLNIPWWESLLAIGVSIPLMLVGIRVFGETNWAPISSMANMVQGLFAFISPGSVASNMVASGMSGTVAAHGEYLMQDYKAGQIIGSNYRHLTYMQLLATPVGALAVAVVYPVLKARYGIGAERFGLDPALAQAGETGLTSPISAKWAGFAELLVNGFDALPAYTTQALFIAVGIGVVVTLVETRWKKYLPSPTGIALGMLIPALYVLPMVLGAVASAVWKKASPESEQELNTPLASGLIVGEALLASLAIPVLAYFFGIGGGGGGGH